MLYAEAQAASIRVSLVTIYNTLHEFTAANLLRETVFDSRRSYFDTNMSDHHHFIFEGPGWLHDIPGDQVVVTHLPDLPAGTSVKRIDVVIRLKEE
jgi:Fur family iron response transcriptional regulator